MRVRFWGTRGSIPVGLTVADVRDKLARALVAASGKRFDSYGDAHAFAEQNLPFSVSHTFGGHTSCVELDTGHDEYFVCDMGSGARAFGEHVLARQSGKPATINIFMSHVHWDHIMGFPFFGPAYVPGMRIRIHGSHDILEKAFRMQQSAPCFPVSFDQHGRPAVVRKPWIWGKPTATQPGSVGCRPSAWRIQDLQRTQFHRSSTRSPRCLWIR